MQFAPPLKALLRCVFGCIAGAIAGGAVGVVVGFLIIFAIFAKSGGDPPGHGIGLMGFPMVLGPTGAILGAAIGLGLTIFRVSQKR